MKHCNKCSKSKSFGEFDRRSAAKDGLCSVCKECRKAQKADHHLRNKERHNARCRTYNRENRESANEKKRAFYLANKEKIREYAKAWRLSNIQRAKDCGKRWRKDNHDRVIAANRNRKAALKNAVGMHTGADVILKFELQRGLCANCKIRLIASGAGRYHVDHIMPLALGGTNSPENIQCLCQPCNNKKHAKDPLAWAKENGRLL